MEVDESENLTQTGHSREGVDDTVLLDTNINQSDESISIELFPETQKVRTINKSINDKNPVKVLERKIDCSWLVRCTENNGQRDESTKLLSCSSIASERNQNNTEDNNVDDVCENKDVEQVLDKSWQRDTIVPRLLTSASTPTNFKGLFNSSKKIGRWQSDYIH